MPPWGLALTDHIDVSQAHRIDQSPGKLLGLLLGLILITAICLHVVTADGSAGIRASAVFWGWLGLVLSGGGAILLGYRFFSNRLGISLTLSPEGLRYSHHSGTFDISWTEVTSIGEYRMRGARMVMVSLSPAGTERRRARLGPVARSSVSVDKLLGLDNRMLLNSAVLEISHRDLLDLVRAYFAAYGGMAKASDPHTTNA